MKQPLRRRPAASGNVLLGLLLIARGRHEGLDCFGTTGDAFLAALSPWLAFLLVSAALALARQPSADRFALVLMSLCGLLLPPVLSHALARLWKREPLWPRYATASAWCGWLVVPAYVPAMIVVWMLLQVGVSPTAAGLALVGLLATYWLWLHWFLARRGLAVSGLAAALLVLVLVLGAAALWAMALLVAPHMLAPLMAGSGAGFGRTM